MQKNDARPSSGSSSGETKLHVLDYWRVIRVRFGIVLLSFLLVVITAAVATYFQPKKYKARLTMQLHMPADAARLLERDNSTGVPAIDPRFVATQTEIIRSSKVLYQVIDEQDLVHKWGGEGGAFPREAAYYRLASMLDLKQIRGTEMMELDVTSTNPDEALGLVNSVVNYYAEEVKSTQKENVDPGIRAQEDTIQKYQQSVKDLENKLAEIRRLHPDIRFATVDEQGHKTDPFEPEIAAAQAQVNDYTTRIAGLNSQLSQVEKLKGDELMRALATLNISDPTVQTILPKYQEAVSAEASLLNSGIGPNHPKLKSLRATREVYTRQLTDQIDSIKHSLSFNLEIARSTLASVTKQLDGLRDKQRKNRVDTMDYDRINDDFIKDKALLEANQVEYAKRKANVTVQLTPVSIINRAEKPTAPSSPRVPLNMAIGVAIGMLVGVGLAFFIEYLDTSVKTMDDVETMLGVPVLAIVPKNIKLLHKQPTDVPDAEAYRILRTNIEFNRKSADANTISMVSGGPGEGKSTTLCNLAFTCAQGGYSVLIVDADLRRPTQHKLFEINNNIGLTNYLTTNIPLDDVILPTQVENLSLMPSGILPADAVGILNSQRMSDMIAELKTRYDIIFFDSPPILGVSDGAVLASEVDQSIIIVQHRRFPRAMLLRVKQAINNVGGTVLGVVLNNVDLRHDPNYAYYTSYYEYYAVRAPKETVTAGNSTGGKRGAGDGSVAVRNGSSESSSEY